MTISSLSTTLQHNQTVKLNDNESKQKPIEILITPEQFAKMGADNIVRFMRKHDHTAIDGDKKGVNRHIIRYRTWRDRMNYVNPYPKF